MHPDTDFSRTIPNSQSPANDALGVVAAAPTAGGGVGPYTPATVYRAFELLSHAHDMLTRCPLPLGPAGHEFIADIATLLEDAGRQRMNAAAAHAFDMQSGGVAHG